MHVRIAATASSVRPALVPLMPLCFLCVLHSEATMNGPALLSTKGDLVVGRPNSDN